MTTPADDRWSGGREAGDRPVAYSDYLRLPDLLVGVRPTTPDASSRTWAAEHFFIVAHQTSELWLKQALLDLDRATATLWDHDPDLATDYVTRAAGTMDLMAEHTGLLRRLGPREFAGFRDRLGTASGAQSVQFRRLHRALGLHGPPSPLWEALAAALTAGSLTLPALYRSAPHGGPLHRVAEAMAELSQAFWRWQLLHIEVVSRTIGRSPGTGGSAGGEYLMRRLQAPFPELWEARSGLSESRPAGADGGDPAAVCPWGTATRRGA